jgi:hypothetical protein
VRVASEECRCHPLTSSAWPQESSGGCRRLGKLSNWGSYGVAQTQLPGCAPAAHRLVEKLGEVVNTMHETQDNIRRFVREHPNLVPALRAIVDLSRENEAQPTSRLGEFCREWLAAREPSTPRTLRPFVDAGLIQGSPRGTGSGRIFYVVTDRAAIEHVLASGSN